MHDQVKYYTTQIFKSMSHIEKLTNKLFQETYPKTEVEFWNAVDSKNKHNLMVINEHLNKEIDRMNQVIESIG